MQTSYYGSTAKSFTQGFQNIKIFYFTNFLPISTEFQSSLLEITKKSLEHYSTESWASQTAPWGFLNFCSEVPGRRGGQRKVRQPFPAAPVAGGEGKEAREVKWARANLLLGSK